MKKWKETIKKLEEENKELKRQLCLPKKNLKGYSRQTILNRDNNRCRLCGSSQEELTIHHLTPRANGGNNAIWNLISVCEACHMFMHCNPKIIGERKKMHKEKIYLGLNNAKNNGKHIGRPKWKFFDEDLARKLLKKGKSQREVAKLLKVSPTTINRFQIGGRKKLGE